MPVDIFGATVTGPAHLREGRPNQDAWGHARVGRHRVVVVADGLGSKPRSSQGARAATAAVPEAVRCWLRHPEAKTEVLLGLVHLLWRAHIDPLEPADAATTCLFALLGPDGSGLLAQLGDGLILVEEDGQVEPLWSRPADSFSDRTQALGCTKQLGAWRTRALAPADRQLLLCTDGVADDLLPGKYGELMGWLDKELRPLPRVRRWRVVAKELRDWPTPRHTDDKTLAFVGSLM